MKSSKSEEISVFESLPHVSRRKFAKRAIIGALGSSILLESLPAPWGDASPLPAVAPGADLPVRNITVDRVETFKVVVPMKPGTVLSENYERVPEIRASWDFESIPKFVIRLHASSGLVGLGETARGESELALAENSKFLPRRNILGLDFANAALGLPQVSTSDGFEIAIYDLIRKTLGVPVHVLLGGRFQDKIAVTYWTGQRNETDLVNIARKASELGFKHLKFKAQNYDPVAQLVRAVDKATPHLENSAGSFRVVDLVPGKYKAKFEVSGFSTLELTEIDVPAGKVTRVDTELKLGETTQLVEVTAEVPLIETSASNFSTTLETKTIEETPLAGRDLQQLVFLVPGIVNVAGPPGSNFGFNSQFGTFPDPTYTQGSNLEAYMQNLFVHTEDRLRYRTALSAQISITDVYSGQTAAKLQEVFGSSTLPRGQLLSTFPFFQGAFLQKCTTAGASTTA